MKKRELAIKLRLSGKSYTQISRELIVAKSTLSSWLANIEIGEGAREQINARGRAKAIEALVKRNRQQTVLAIERATKLQNDFSRRIGSLSRRDVLMIGLALYWAEGHKRLIVKDGKERTYHPVELTNSDPGIVKIFIRFLRETFGVVPRDIKVELRLFEHQDAGRAIDFWSKATSIPRKNFRKPYYGISISSRGKRPYYRLEHGIIRIVLSKTVLFHKILGGIEGIKKLV